MATRASPARRRPPGGATGSPSAASRKTRRGAGDAPRWGLTSRSRRRLMLACEQVLSVGGARAGEEAPSRLRPPAAPAPAAERKVPPMPNPWPNPDDFVPTGKKEDDDKKKEDFIAAMAKCWVDDA